MANRKRYSIEFQTDVAKMVLKEKRSISDVSKELGIDYSVIWRWKNKFKKLFDPAAPSRIHDGTCSKEISDLNEKLERVIKERDILMKALSHFFSK
jgi:transposase-like protein